MAAKTITLITGETSIGKTTKLLQWAQQQQQVGGVLTPLAANGQRQFYKIAAQQWLPMETDVAANNLHVGRFIFLATAFVTINTLLLSELAANEFEYVVIDEIGPLELQQQKGLNTVWQQILNTAQVVPHIIIVVRSKCLQQVKDLLVQHNKNFVVSSIDEFVNVNSKFTPDFEAK
jgi:nucleoside-triphosphatase THEP1